MNRFGGQAERLSVYGVAGMVFFFVGCVAAVLAAALGVEWFAVLMGVAWVAALVMVITGAIKSA